MKHHLFHKIIILLVLTSLILTNVSPLFFLQIDSEIAVLEFIDIDDKETDTEEKEEQEKEQKDKIIPEFRLCDYKIINNYLKGKSFAALQNIHVIEITTPPPEHQPAA